MDASRSGREKTEVSIPKADRTERTHLEAVSVGATNNKKSLLELEESEGRHWEVWDSYIFLKQSTGHKSLTFSKAG